MTVAFRNLQVAQSDMDKSPVFMRERFAQLAGLRASPASSFGGTESYSPSRRVIPPNSAKSPFPTKNSFAAKLRKWVQNGRTPSALRDPTPYPYRAESRALAERGVLIL
jgi:hypothetical protein